MWIGQINAIIRRYYHVDPDELTDENWIRLYNEFIYTEKLRLKSLEKTIKDALGEVLSNIKI